MSNLDRQTSKLNWMVPTVEWERFREFVKDENPGLKGYLGRTLEKAMEEYAATDGYEDAETKLLDIAGGTRSELREKIKNIPTDDDDDADEALSGDALAEAEKTMVGAKVDVLVADNFRRTANSADDPYGIELARAMRSYRAGGRAGRLERLADRIAAESSEQAEAEAEEEEGPYAHLDHTDKLKKRMADEIDGSSFTREELDAAICEHSTGTAHYLNKFDSLVVEELNVIQNPATGVYLPRERVDSTVETIADGLEEQFTTDVLREAVQAELGGGRAETESWYCDLVRDELNVQPHPINQDLLVTPDRADEIRSDLTEEAEQPDRPEPDDGGDEGDEDEPPLPETQFRDSVDKWRNGSDGTEPQTWIIKDWLEEYGLESPPNGMALENWPPDAAVDATAPGEEAPYVTGD